MNPSSQSPPTAYIVHYIDTLSQHTFVCLLTVSPLKLQMFWLSKARHNRAVVGHYIYIYIYVDFSVCPTLDSLLSIGYRVYLYIKIHTLTCSYLTTNFVMLTHTGGCLLSPTLTVLEVNKIFQILV